MKKLKIILKSKYILYILFFLTIFRISCINNNSIFNINDNIFTCTIINIDSNKYSLDCGELLETNLDDSNLKIGDVLIIDGTLSKYNSNTNFNLFNYKEYQENRNIYYSIKIKEYKILKKSTDIILNIKRVIYDRIKNLKSFNYLNALILGNKSGIDTNTLKNMGIIHLFSISGMHISFLVNVIDNCIRKEKHKNKIILIFLLFYYLLIKSVSLLRCIIFFIIKKVNKNCDLTFNKYKEILISILLILFIRPKAIFDIGFYYSIILSSGITILNIKIKMKNKILKNIIMSIYIFFLSFPLNISTSFEVNILSILYNLIFIPFISFILFPISLLTLIFPFLDSILLIIINLFEFLINIFKDINFILIFSKPSILLIIIYYLIIYIMIINKKIVYLLLFIIFIHFNHNFIFKSKYIIFLDVGQGDSSLIHIDNKNILIDTGGNINRSISDNITIPLLKSYGIRKLDYLIITHGDFDHMGEAVNLVKNFKVDKVIFNCGDFDELESELIKELNNKKIPYYSCIKELEIKKRKLYFLQTKEYDNENDNSNVIYTEIDGYKFMFMGDAGILKEKDILDKYNILNIDVLKVGHHGSKTSSSEDFIDKMRPKYSVISVGMNNRYGHPNKEVLGNLKDTKIYRTDEDGSIMFKIKNNKLKIETCSP